MSMSVAMERAAKKLFAPKEKLGEGMNLSWMALEMGLMREAGIMLPGKGVPVTGSLTMRRPEKSPERMPTVGTMRWMAAAAELALR